MLGRVMVAGGTIFMATAFWFGLQPEPTYLNYDPLPEPEAYFPVSPGGEVKVWYARRNIARMGAVLQEIEEPTLFYRTEDEPDWEIRFVLLPETGEPVIARVRPTEDGYALVVKEARVDSSGNLAGVAGRAVTRSLSATDVDDLQDGLEALSFFSLTGPAPETEAIHLGLINLSVDRSRGDLWAVEWRRGREDDDYHLVLRDSRVDLTGFETLASDLLARARISPTYADHPVFDYSTPKAPLPDETTE